LKAIVLTTLIFTSILALTIPSLSNAISETRSATGNGELTERQAEILEKFKHTSEIEKRGTAVYMARKGATQWLEWAIQGGYVSANTKTELTLLTAAATYGHLDTVKMLLLQKADIELKDEAEDTPLKAAARAGQLEIVNYLLLKGANPNGEGKGGSTPLSSATYAGRIDIVNVLLRYGATIKSNNFRGTLVHLAAKSGHIELIEYFVEQGVDINQRDRNGWTALAIATHAGQTESVAKLVTLKADINNPTNRLSSPLILAAQKGFEDITAILIDGNAKLDLEDEKDRSALWWAAKNGHKRVVELLQQEGASPDTAVSRFAKKGHLQAIKTLIESGIPLKVTNEEERTGLHIAARYGHLDIVKYYVEKGLDIHTKDIKGYSPLHRASGYGQTKVAKYLLERGSNPNWEGEPNKWTPVSLAARYGHVDILQMLHRRGGDLNRLTHKGWSPLMLAAYGKKPLAVKYLLENDVDTELQNIHKHTALDIAFKSEKKAVIELLSDNALLD